MQVTEKGRSTGVREMVARSGIREWWRGGMRKYVKRTRQVYGRNKTNGKGY